VQSVDKSAKQFYELLIQAWSNNAALAPRVELFRARYLAEARQTAAGFRATD